MVWVWQPDNGWVVPQGMAAQAMMEPLPPSAALEAPAAANFCGPPPGRVVVDSLSLSKSLGPGGSCDVPMHFLSPATPPRSARAPLPHVAEPIAAPFGGCASAAVRYASPPPGTRSAPVAGYNGGSMALLPCTHPSPTHILMPTAGAAGSTAVGIPTPQGVAAGPQTPAMPVSVPVQMVPSSHFASSRRSHRSVPPAKSQQQATSMPNNLLARIDTVVSEMERELSADLAVCANPPLREMRRNDSNANALCVMNDNENPIDWLDKQIFAIEQRREACEMRQSHLAELRKIVTDGHGWPLVDRHGRNDDSVSCFASHRNLPALSNVSGDEHVEEDTYEEKAPSRRRSAKGARSLEVDRSAYDHMAQQAEILARQHAEQQGVISTWMREVEEWRRKHSNAEIAAELRLGELHSAAEAIEGHERRATLTEEAAQRHAAQTALDLQSWQERCQEAESTADRERALRVEALDAQAKTEQDLRSLEDNAGVVLADCKSLRDRVRELQEECDVLGQTHHQQQASFEAERHSLGQQVRSLEDHRKSLEADRQSLADEHNIISRQHSIWMRGHEEQVASEMIEFRQQEDRLRREHQSEVARLVERECIARETALAELREDHAKHHLRRQSQVSELEHEVEQKELEHQRTIHGRVADLEGELAEVLATREYLTKQAAELKTQKAELETQVEEAVRLQEYHSRHHHSFKEAHGRMEEHVAEVQASKDEQARLIGALQHRIADVEQQVADTMTERELQRKSHTSLKLRHYELEEQAAELHVSKGHQLKTQRWSQDRIADLESELLEVQRSNDQHVKAQRSMQNSVSDLEAQLEHARSLADQRHKQLSTYQNKAAELESSLQDASSEKDHHSKALNTMRVRVQELEALLDDAQSQKSKSHSFLVARIEELEQQVSSHCEQKDDHAKCYRALQQRIADLEGELMEAHGAFDDHTQKQAASQKRATELEQTAQELQALLEEAQSNKSKTHSFMAARIEELEQQLNSTYEQKDEYTKNSKLLQDRIAHLETELSGLQLGFEEPSKLKAAHHERVRGLEQSIEQIARERDREHAAHADTRARMEELEAILGERQSHYQARVKELEDGLDEQNRFHSMRAVRIAELEKELQTQQEKHADASRAHSAKVEGLERDLQDGREQIASHQRQLQQARGLHAEMQSERETAEKRYSGRATSLEQENAQLKHAMSRLQREVDTAREAHEAADRNHEEQRAKIESYGAALQKLERDVEKLNDDLTTERKVVESLQQDLENSRALCGDVKDQANQALDATDRARRAEVMDKNHQISTLTRQLAELRQSQREKELSDRGDRLSMSGIGSEPSLSRRGSGQHGDVSESAINGIHTQRGTRSSASSDIITLHGLEAAMDERSSVVGAVTSGRHRPGIGRSSIAPDVNLFETSTAERSSVLAAAAGAAATPTTTTIPMPSRASLAWQHIPGPESRGLFQRSFSSVDTKVRSALEQVEATVERVGSFHANHVDAHLLALVEVWPLDELPRKAELDAERTAIAELLGAARADLLALKDELVERPQLSPDREVVAEQIDAGLGWCDDEARLLKIAHPLSSLPDVFSQMLVENKRDGREISARSTGELQTHNDNGATLLHWAAQWNRRDIFEYVLRQPNGSTLLHVRDSRGFTPMVVADNSGHGLLSVFLRMKMEPSPRVRRPDFLTLPGPYQAALDHVETQGWASVQWRDNYTLLHWSATKGHADLCRYLLRLRADPGTRDAQGRTPADCAKDSGHGEITEILRAEMSDDGSSVSGASTQRRAVIPEGYLQVMDQIDHNGWDAMDWGNNFTLLHWAAKKDLPELCARFMAQGADPHHADDSGRDAFDHAREHSSMEALAQLERGAPAGVPAMPPFAIASRRVSKEVIASMS